MAREYLKRAAAGAAKRKAEVEETVRRMLADIEANGDAAVAKYARDLDKWTITFVDTGLHSNIGERLLRVRRYLDGEPVFLANYADGLSDLPLDRHVAQFLAAKDLVASFAAVPSSQSFHAVHADASGMVTQMGGMPDEPLLINGGFFVFRSEIFRYIGEGEELVEAPFARLIAERRLSAFRWRGSATRTSTACARAS